MKRIVIAAFAAFTLGMAAAAGGLWQYQRQVNALALPASPVWEEAEWPLPPDQWGRGKFFRCRKDVCGGEIRLYIRAKLGFCKCDVGVDDDDELDRIGDLAAFSDHPVALGPGRAIKVAWMRGRSRSFALRPSMMNAPTALSVGFNDHCDAIIATAVSDGSRAAAAESAVLDFLNGDVVMQWAKVTLGL
jgi:hypothetical protein